VSKTCTENSFPEKPVGGNEAMQQNGFYAHCEEGLSLLWGNKFDEAEAFFTPMKHSDARASLLYAEVCWRRPELRVKIVSP
jgi:hypothetical protein